MSDDRAPDPLAALDRVVRLRRFELAGLARREGLGAEDALDCVHDALCTFLGMSARRELPDGDEACAALVAGIVVNTARNKRRRHHLARPHGPLDDARAAGGVDAEALLAHAEACVRLRGCMDRLCEKQRTVVMMRLLEERPGEDVAEALGVTRGYVDVLLHRAKASLKVCMRADES